MTGPGDATGLGRVIDRPDWSGGRVAVLGDIHANHPALTAAARAVEAAGIDRVVCHGDLLTYGCAPVETLDALGRLAVATDFVLLVGNHDGWYFETGAGDPGDYRLPGGDRRYIADSVEWTRERLADRPTSDLTWHDACTVGDVLVAHAHPFGPGPWRYLNHTDDEADAGAALAANGARVGVFGHTHRPRLTAVTDAATERHPLDGPVALDRPPQQWVLNTGTVGQPRGEGSSWLELDLGERTATVHQLHYDVDPHLDAIRASGLPPGTVERLCRFFPAPAAGSDG